MSDRPPFRRLRGYAFDPSLSLKLDTASINHTVFEVPWETGLAPGPCGEYVEVVDYDPSSGCWYDPVDLNGPELSEGDLLSPIKNLTIQKGKEAMDRLVGAGKRVCARQWLAEPPAPKVCRVRCGNATSDLGLA